MMNVSGEGSMERELDVERKRVSGREEESGGGYERTEMEREGRAGEPRCLGRLSEGEEGIYK